MLKTFVQIATFFSCGKENSYMEEKGNQKFIYMTGFESWCGIVDTTLSYESERTQFKFDIFHELTRCPGGGGRTLPLSLKPIPAIIVVTEGNPYCAGMARLMGLHHIHCSIGKAGASHGKSTFAPLPASPYVLLTESQAHSLPRITLPPPTPSFQPALACTREVQHR